MKRPASLIAISAWPAGRWLWTRRLVLVVLLIIFGLLSLYPERYRASVILAPQNTNTAGLSSILSQLGGNYAALLGNQQPIEIDLAVARSQSVALQVARDLQLLGQPDYQDPVEAIRTLEEQVTIRAQRGGLVEISVKMTDGELARRVAERYAQGLQGRLGELSRAQTDYKRTILNERMAAAQDRLRQAERAVSDFRRANTLPAPEQQLGASVGQLASLRAQLQAKQVELEGARRFMTDENIQVRAILTQISTLQAQIRALEGSTSTQRSGPSAGAIAQATLEYENLQRELRFAQSLYEAYTRYIEGAAIEELTADFNMQILEPAHIDAERQYNFLFVGLFFATLGFGILTEIYRLSAPIVRRRIMRAGASDDPEVERAVA